MNRNRNYRRLPRGGRFFNVSRYPETKTFISNVYERKIPKRREKRNSVRTMESS
jgi:hypothetical protein